MKKSKFNIFISLDDGNTLLYNTLTKNKVIINKKMENLIDRCRNTATLNMKQLGLLDSLKNIGVIVEDEADEYQEIQKNFNIRKFDTDTINSKILITTDCNLICKSGVCKKNEEGINKFLDIDTTDKICKWLLKKVKKAGAKNLNVTLSGGEPLINKGSIYFLCKKLHKETKKNGTKLNIKLETNGLLLNHEIIKDLKQYGLNILNISIFSDEKTHNKIVSSDNDENVFQTLISNITSLKKMVKFEINFYYNNMTKKNIPPVLAEFNKLGLNSSIERLIFSSNKNLFNSSLCSVDSSCSKNYSCTDDLLWLSDESTKMGFKSLKRIAPVPCDAIREHTYVFDTEGYIYKCSSLVSKKEFSIGHIDSDLKNTDNKEFLTMDVPERCMNCKLIPICSGVCKISKNYEDSMPTHDECMKKYFENISKRLLVKEYYADNSPHSKA